MTDGYLFIWILDMKEDQIKKRLAQRNFKFKGQIIWEKVTRNGKPVSGSGVTTRHNTETCYIFKRGNTSSFAKFHRANDLVRAVVRGEFTKPMEVYDQIRKLVPEWHAMEIFCRWHHVQPNVVCVGNQLRVSRD